MPLDTVSILEGNTFVVSDRRGDLEASPSDTHGLFLNDTRFLSRWILTINGMRPKVLSTDDTAYFKVQFFMALATGTVYVDSHLSVIRQREVNSGFREQLTLVNHAQKSVELELNLDVDADFADLFEVKDKLKKRGELYRRFDPESGLIIGYRRESYVRETRIRSSMPGILSERGFLFRIRLEPHATWTTELDVHAEFHAAVPQAARKVPDDLNKDLEAWIADAPRLVSSWRPLEAIYRRSIVDLAALRFRTPLTKAALPAAGLPWFMTIFGRDSLITSYQALPYFPKLAAGTLETLALFQALTMDAFRDEEPGKILHELRLGEMTGFEERPHSPYYGSADSTPLFLILLEEYVRWTGDHALAHKLRRNVEAALVWIDEHGDRDGDGYVEYERRVAETGLDNQCWKDSWDSIAFANGTIAQTPRATCEIQGYVYDAKCRIARLARDVYGDAQWAQQLESEAAVLKERFNRDFWITERKFFALALDRDKRKVDSLTSNIGHLLWSGIADVEKAHACVAHLMGPELFSGWGIRTMAVGEGSYNPIGYHVGTVWPHDTSIIALGLRRYGYREEAALLAQGLLDAAELFGGRLPEAFAGYDRAATHYPVEYPTACSPQAWASGAPLLLIRALMGLDSDGRHLLMDPALPTKLEELQLLDIPGAWRRMDAFGRARSTAGHASSAGGRGTEFARH